MTREEIIIEARRKRDAGDFNREIVSRTPTDLFIDLVMLDCGHQGSEVRPFSGRAEPHACELCTSDWMRAAMKGDVK